MTVLVKLFFFSVQRISPETSSKVQLQVVFHNDTSYNFHFANSVGRPAQLKDRDEIKDLLAELIPQHRQKVNKDLEKKNKYVYTCVKKIISDFISYGIFFSF